MSRQAIYWFRNDLRLHDARLLAEAAAECEQLELVYCHDTRLDGATRWSTAKLMSQRMGRHRRRYLLDTLLDLQQSLVTQQQSLRLLVGDPAAILQREAARLGVDTIYAEEIAAPEERAIVQQLQAAGLTVKLCWQSSLLEPLELPFEIGRLPRVFTQFRRVVEASEVAPVAAIDPVSLPPSISPLERHDIDLMLQRERWAQRLGVENMAAHPLAALPYLTALGQGGERSALNHLDRYFSSSLPQRYKETRNGLLGFDYSTKFSAWLASGALSPRQIWQRLQQHELQQGANESTYWIKFELLWRDYFRFLHLQHGNRLYLAGGLSGRAAARHDAQAFARWCCGETGNDFIDAGMRELVETGYLSNRMRQNVASYLLNDLGCDWRAGAAWFEATLIDYDVYSNTGNWLYLAGCGTDPRDGRRFDPQKQAAHYDSDGRYRLTWLPERSKHA